MLSVNINQNVEQYRETVAFGLDSKQTWAAIKAIAAGVALMCLLHFGIGLPIEVSIWLALPVCVPIMLPALQKKYGLTVTEQFKEANRRKSELVYASRMPVERKEIHKNEAKTGWKCMGKQSEKRARRNKKAGSKA